MAKTLSRSAMLARDLLGRIARRELRPGDPIDLPALGRRHGVSRTVVREALADLGGKGLIVARPKVGTTIAPEAQWNLLDPTLVKSAIAEPGTESMLAETNELRRVIEPAIAAAASRDAGRAQRLAILEAVRSIADAVGTGDPGRLIAAQAAFHAALAEACANRLLRSIDRALIPVRALHLQRHLDASSPTAWPGADVSRLIALQTGLGVAAARGDTRAATAHGLAVATLAAASAPVGDPTDPRSADDRPVPLPAATARDEPAGPAHPAAAAQPAAADPADDWPDTVTLKPTLPEPLIPVRRGSFADLDARPGPEVPALGVDPPAHARPTLATAGL